VVATTEVPAIAGLADRSNWDVQLLVRSCSGYRVAEGVDCVDGQRRPLSRRPNSRSSRRHPREAHASVLIRVYFGSSPTRSMRAQAQRALVHLELPSPR
jgi:hypothetical protein